MTDGLDVVMGDEQGVGDGEIVSFDLFLFSLIVLKCTLVRESVVSLGVFVATFHDIDFRFPTDL